MSVSESHSNTSAPRVLITGGARRLGKFLSLAMSGRNATVGINYFTTPLAEVEKLRSECLMAGASTVHLVPGDVTKDPEHILERFADLSGGLDILINNAGVLPPQRKLEELTLDAFRATLELNLIAPFALSRVAAKLIPMGGAIVNLASLGGVQIWKERIDYNVSKAALIALTKALARELAPNGIRVNAVAPGAIDLERGLRSSALESFQSEASMGVPVSRIPIGRYGSAEDITKAVLFLAFDAPYVTGETIIVDGGRSLT